MAVRQGLPTPRRMLWSRVLPGTVVVVAALAVPEFSVGAGDLSSGRKALGAAQGDGVGITAANAPVSLATPMIAAPDRAPSQTGTQAFNLTIAQPVAVPDLSAPPVAAFPVPLPDQPAPGLAVAVEVPVVAAVTVPETLSDSASAAQSILPAPASLPQTELALTFFTGPLPGAAIPLEASVLTLVPALDEVAIPEADPAVVTLPTMPTQASAAPAAAAAAPVTRSDAIASPAAGTAKQALVTASAAPLADLRAVPLSFAERPELTTSAAPAAVVPAPIVAAPAPQARVPATRASVPVTRVPDQPAVVRVASAPVRAAPPVVARAPVSPSPSAAVAASAAISVAPSPPRVPAAQPAREAASAPPTTRPAPALAGIPRAGVPAGAPGAAADAATQLEIRSQLLARIDGKAAGQLDFQQTTSGLLVRLGSLADVLSDRLDPAIVARIRSSSSANLYLPLARLQADGIPISYDPVYDEFNIGLVDTRPQAARKVHMDQITTPERGLGSVSIGQVPRQR